MSPWGYSVMYMISSSRSASATAPAPVSSSMARMSAAIIALALLFVHDDVAVPQPVHVARKASATTESPFERKRWPFDDVAARDARHVEVDDLVAEKGDDPVDGPAELEVAPPHRIFFWKGMRGMASGSRPPRTSTVFLPVSTFSTQSSSAVLFTYLELRYIDALGPGEPYGGGRRLPFRVEGAGSGRTEFYRDRLFLFFRHVVDHEGYAPGRAESPHRAAVDAQLEGRP